MLKPLKMRVKIGKKYYNFKGIAVNRTRAKTHCRRQRKLGNSCRSMKINGEYAIYIRKR